MSSVEKAEPKRGRGRPPGAKNVVRTAVRPNKEITITAQVPEEFHAQIVAFAEAADLSVSQLIRRALKEMISSGKLPRL